MVLRNFDLFKKKITYDASSRVILKSYESSEDEIINGVYKELPVGKVLFYRLADQLYIEVNENRFRIDDIKQYKEQSREGVLLLENRAGSMELKEPLEKEALADPFTMSSDDDFKFLQYIENIRLSRAKQEIIFNHK